MAKWLLSLLAGSLLFVSSNVAHATHFGSSYNSRVVVRENVIIERHIPIYDTTIVLPHKQFFNVFPQQKIVEKRVVERIVAPQKIIIERQFAPQYVERVIVPQKEKVIVERVEVIHNHHNQSFLQQRIQRFLGGY